MKRLDQSLGDDPSTFVVDEDVLPEMTGNLSGVVVQLRRLVMERNCCLRLAEDVLPQTIRPHPLFL
jgi:hypothetical protein